MKTSLLSCFLATGLSVAALQAAEPFPITFIALGGTAQPVMSSEELEDYERPFAVSSDGIVHSDGDCPCGVTGYRAPHSHCVPSRYAEVSGMLMHRVGTGLDRVLVTEGGAPAIETRDLDDLTGGFQALVGWHLFGSANSAVELSFFGLYDWNSNASLTSPANNLVAPGLAALTSPNFIGASQVDLQYDSSLYNVEANYIRSFYARGAQIDFLSGFRYIHLDERLGITSDNTTTFFGAPLVPGVGAYDVTARNNLFGHQIGGRYSRPIGRWSLQTIGKAGVFLNDASTSRQLTDSTLLGPTNLLITANDQSVAALGELGIFGRRQLTDTWALKIGYQATGIGGVALATDQQTPYETQTSSGIRADSFFFMHGGIFGLEAAW